MRIGSASPRHFDSLESRTLFSVAAPTSNTPVAHATVAPLSVAKTPAAVATTYNLMNLLGYSHRGSTWAYNNSYALQATGYNPVSANAVTNIAVGPNQANINGKLGNYVYAAGGVTFAATYGTDTTGMTLLSQSATSTSNTTNLKFTGVRVAPSVVAIGGVYTDTGTFTGNLSFLIGGQTYFATASGVAAVRTAVTQGPAVLTPAGTFLHTVRVDYSIKLTGTVILNYQGRKLGYSLVSNTANTFYGVGGVGIVYSTFSNVNNYTSPGLPTERTAVSSVLKLRSYHIVL